MACLYAHKCFNFVQKTVCLPCIGACRGIPWSPGPSQAGRLRPPPRCCPPGSPRRPESKIICGAILGNFIHFSENEKIAKINSPIKLTIVAAYGSQVKHSRTFQKIMGSIERQYGSQIS